MLLVSDTGRAIFELGHSEKPSTDLANSRSKRSGENLSLPVAWQFPRSGKAVRVSQYTSFTPVAPIPEHAGCLDARIARASSSRPLRCCGHTERSSSACVKSGSICLFLPRRLKSDASR